MYVRPIPKKPPGVTVSLEHTIYPAVERSVRSLGYEIVTDDRITVLFWHDGQVSIDFCLRFKPWQFLNHFPGTFAIANKVALARSLERQQRRFPDLYDFHPMSFALPGQMCHFKLRLSKSRKTYIVKPDLGSQGRGIFLVQEPDHICNFREAAIAQQYIAPYLLSGLKFDLRIYVLLASVSPLRVYIFQEGMARFCTEQYAPPDSDSLGSMYRHLTNYSVNKHNSSFHENPDVEGTYDSSHKCSMASVFEEITRKGGDVIKLRAEIERIVVLTVLSGHAFLRHNYEAAFRADDGRSRCFEILGFDILVDHNLKPWVLEVNHSPSFHCGSNFDKELKENVISQALRIVDIPFDIYEFIQQAQKDRAFDSAALPAHRSYSFDRESLIAQSTSFKLLYPPPDGHPLREALHEVFQAAEEMSRLGLSTTQAVTRGTVEQEQRIFIPRVPRLGIDPTRPTRSVLLLQQAKKAKMIEDLRGNSPFVPDGERRSKSSLITRLSRHRRASITISDSASQPLPS
jgi:tubulin polyglutamylase TTLL6/13